MDQPINICIYFLMILWALISSNLFFKQLTPERKEINPYIYDNIPTIFVTLGVLGTFLGIYVGLQDFDVNDINNSIPKLLAGLKTAFLTSIIGIICSIVFEKLSSYFLFKSENAFPPPVEDNVQALNMLIEQFKQHQESTNQGFDRLGSKIEYSFTENKNYFEKDIALQEKMNVSLEQMVQHSAAIEDGQKYTNTSLEHIKTSTAQQDKTLLSISETLEANTQQVQHQFEEIRSSIQSILNHAKESNLELIEKLDAFQDILAENNTKALVAVMEEATRSFNEQMSAIIQRLVQENFQALNESVTNLNNWQQEHKENVVLFTEQYRQVTANFTTTSKELNNISKHTNALVGDSSHLKQLITELQAVMIHDKKFKNIIASLEKTIETVQVNTARFDETTNKLNDWITAESGYKDAVHHLALSLSEVDNINKHVEQFWEGTRNHLNEGALLVKQHVEVLKEGLDDINEEFKEQLSDMVNNLDELIQRLIENQK